MLQTLWFVLGVMTIRSCGGGHYELAHGAFVSGGLAVFALIVSRYAPRLGVAAAILAIVAGLAIIAAGSAASSAYLLFEDPMYGGPPIDSKIARMLHREASTCMNVGLLSGGVPMLVAIGALFSAWVWRRNEKLERLLRDDPIVSGRELPSI